MIGEREPLMKFWWATVHNRVQLEWEWERYSYKCFVVGFKNKHNEERAKRVADKLNQMELAVQAYQAQGKLNELIAELLKEKE